MAGGQLQTNNLTIKQFSNSTINQFNHEYHRHKKPV